LRVAVVGDTIVKAGEAGVEETTGVRVEVPTAGRITLTLTHTD
jgi:hypothetical protein